MEASLKGFEALSDKFYIAQVLDDLGWSHNMMIKVGIQQDLVLRSLALRRELGDKIGMANSLRNLGGSQGGTFDSTDAAVTYWQEAKEIAYSMNDRLGVAWNAGLQAINLVLHGEFDRAQTLIDKGYPHAAEINDPVVKGFIQAVQGVLVALRDEDYERGQDDPGGSLSSRVSSRLSPDDRATRHDPGGLRSARQEYFQNFSGFAPHNRAIQQDRISRPDSDALSPDYSG
jgi:hypothetical protein